MADLIAEADGVARGYVSLMGSIFAAEPDRFIVLSVGE